MSARRYGIGRHNAASGASSAPMVDQTAELLAAYVSRNALPSTDLPQAIRQIHAALSALQNDASHAPAPDLPNRSAIADSIRHDRLVSFVDGKAYKSLKRHLAAHGMTPDEYRRRYGLPSDYPMVSPAYAKLRSRIAREIQNGFKAA
jgi:predicted transcriptional regulator